MAVLVLLLLVGTAGCSLRAGAPTSDSGWQEQADKTLGTALSSLGTARVLLENQAEGRMTRSYAVVGTRDAIAVLDKEAASFLAAQPPASRTAANRRVVAQVQDALVVLNHAAVAAADGDDRTRADALAEVRDAYGAVQDLQDDVAGGGS